MEFALLETVIPAATSLYRIYGKGFTLEQLSQKTGLSRASIYRKIGSKNQLLRQLAEQGLIEFNVLDDMQVRIFLATRAVVATQGFINCTMQQIADHAKIGIATLYRHFPEKEKLLLAYVTDLKKSFSIELSFESGDDFKTGMQNMVETMLQFVSENHDLMHILFFSSVNERKYLRAIRDASSGSATTFDLITKYIKKHIDAGDISSVVSAKDMVGMLVGQILQFAITMPSHFNRPLNIKQDAEAIVNVFCNGVCVISNKDEKL